MWVDPLKNASRPLGIGHSQKSESSNVIHDVALFDPIIKKKKIVGWENHQYFRIDPPHINDSGSVSTGLYRGKRIPIDYHHININFGESAPYYQRQFEFYFNHQRLPIPMYNALKNFSESGKIIRTGGRYLLAAGTVLDVVELGLALQKDLTDADKKLGYTTLSSACSIVGSSLGGAIGTNLGAALGALTGPFSLVAVPVLAFAGGAIGSFAGDNLSGYLLDITCLEE